MKYAHAKAIPFVAMVGEDEMQKGEVQLKNMEDGEQRSLNIKELLELMTK